MAPFYKAGSDVTLHPKWNVEDRPSVGASTIQGAQAHIDVDAVLVQTGVPL